MTSNQLEYVVGALAEDSYVQERAGGRAAVFVNSLQVVQFAVRPLCRLPAAAHGARLFHGFSTDLERHGLLDDYAASAEERVQRLRDFLSGQLLVFRPSQRGQYWNMTDVYPVSAPLAHQSESQYCPLPVCNQDADGMPLDLLLQKLSAQEPLGCLDQLSTELAETPPCIVWREGQLGGEPWQLIGSFAGHRCDDTGCLLVPNEELRIARFQEPWETEVFEVPHDPHLLFVTEQVQTLMRQALAQATPHRPSESESEQVVTSVHSGPTQEQPAAADNPESEFLRRLGQLARSQGLLYSPADLVNFHTAMKMSSLVILTGLSGTGKSRLIRLYGQALGLSDEQLSFVPVRPAWTDDADLLGYPDEAHSLYRVSESGLLRTLIAAAHNSERLYLVCLDEMNLARVEHYFSQLLSVLELPLPERKLRLYPDDLGGKLYNSAQYPATIQLGDNLLFAGTVNLDESTYHFSDKVLDRANVIPLAVQPFAELASASSVSACAVPETTMALWRSFRKETAGSGLERRETELLWQLHQELQAASPALGIGYRVVMQIGRYLQNLPHTAHLSRADALDRQLLQRVFPKVRGPEAQLSPLLGEYRREQTSEGRLLALLDRFTDLSDFSLCRMALAHKGRDLVQHGYTV